MDNTRYIIVQHTSDEDVGDSGLCHVMPKGDVAAITDSDIKEYFSDVPEYYAGKKDVYGGRHYHNVYAVFKMTM